MRTARTGLSKSTTREAITLIPVLITAAIFILGAHHVLSDASRQWWIVTAFLWLFMILLTASISVARHAEVLGAKCGEPFGTMILTLSVVAIEAMTIAAVMMRGTNNPTLAAATMMAVIMIILNGMVGLSLLFGGIRYREQQYNLQGANSYITVIVVLCVLGLVLPSVYPQGTTTHSIHHQIFQICMSLGIYVIFLFIQTQRHRGYFIGPESIEIAEHPRVGTTRSLLYHSALLVTYLIAVVLLARRFAIPLDYAFEKLGASQALGGVIIAALVCTPELIEAVRAAWHNHLQRSVNISLGSVLATICLTIPVILLVGMFTHHDVYLGLHGSALVLLLLTLFVSVITFTTGKTNILQGSVHLLLFLAYLFYLA